jgi:hypothetical protein
VPDLHLDALWRELESAFDDEPRHAAFLDYCAMTQQLGEAAARYREEARRAAEAGEDARAEDAKKRLDGVVVYAMHQLDAAPRTEPDAWARKARTLGVVVGAVLMAIGIWMALKLR